MVLVKHSFRISDLVVVGRGVLSVWFPSVPAGLRVACHSLTGDDTLAA